MLVIIGIGFAVTFAGGTLLVVCVNCSKQIKEEKESRIKWDTNDDCIIINGAKRVSLKKVLSKRHEDEGHFLLDHHSEEEV